MRQLCLLVFSFVTLFLSCDTHLWEDGLNKTNEPTRALTITVQSDLFATKAVHLSNELPIASAIGVFVKNSNPADLVQLDVQNIRFTNRQAGAGKRWEPDREIYLNQEACRVYAYYPYSESVTDVTSIPVTTDGQTDYLYVTNEAEVSKSSNTANLQMAHALTAITLNIKRGTYAGPGLITQVAFQGGGIAKTATLNAKTGELTQFTGVAEAVSMETALTMTDEAQAVHTLVVPNGETSAMKISLWVDGEEYYTVTTDLLLEQGNRYEYNLTVDEGELALSSLHVGNWGYNPQGDPVFWAGGYSVTLTGQMDSMAFFNEFKEDGSIRITAVSMSKEGFMVSPVSCEEGLIEQTAQELDRIIDIKEVAKNMVIVFDGLYIDVDVFQRFYPAGTYQWTVPDGVTEVEVFLVGGGAGGAKAGSYYKSGSGSGYTKTYRGHDYVKPASGTWMGTYDEGRDGNAIEVTEGQVIEIRVGAGGAPNSGGGTSYFMNYNYAAGGGYCGSYGTDAGSLSGGSGGSGGGSFEADGGTNGANGRGGRPGSGQGHTTRDFGEPTGMLNAAGSAGDTSASNKGGYSEGSGSNNPNSGYGGAGNGNDYNTGGGDGTVCLRYKRKAKR